MGKNGQLQFHLESRGFWGGQQRTELDLEKVKLVCDQARRSQKFQERKLRARGSTAQRTQN